MIRRRGSQQACTEPREDEVLKFYHCAMCCVHNVRMSDERTLTLRQADQARADFYVIETELEAIQAQLARVPTRAYVCRLALTATAAVCALIGFVALLLAK